MGVDLGLDSEYKCQRVNCCGFMISGALLAGLRTEATPLFILCRACVPWAAPPLLFLLPFSSRIYGPQMVVLSHLIL